MPEATYLPERQTEYWTSRQIEEFFLDVGYSVVTIPLSQVVEQHIPSDFIYVDQSRTKIFGLQYKALYHNSQDHWKLNEGQHKALQRFPWMYYCTSELKHISESRGALHFSRFYRPNFQYRQRLTLNHPTFTPGYRRWGAFFQNFQECKIGCKISDRKEFLATLGQCRELRIVEALVEQILDVFFVNLDSKRVIHAQCSPFNR